MVCDFLSGGTPMCLLIASTVLVITFDPTW
jgi:hypothetical protein